MQWAREQEAALVKSASVPAAVRVTFKELLDTYTNEIAGPMGRTKAAALTHIGKHLGEYRLSELQPRVFLDFARRRENEGAGPPTILMDFSFAGTVLKHAGVHLDAREAATAARVALAEARSALRHGGRIGSAKERSRRPTNAELAKLKAHWEAKGVRQILPMWDLTLFAIATAMRAGEICSVRWEDFDEEARTILIRDRKDPQNKFGNDQLVPLLHGPAVVLGEVVDPVAIMLRQPSAARRQGRVFPYSPGTIGTVFPRAVQACEIEDLHFHDFRHDGTSRLFEAGYRIEQVSLVTGHKTWESLKRYTNLNPVSLHRDRGDKPEHKPEEAPNQD